MKLDKANKRDKMSRKQRQGHKTSGKSVFLIQEVLIKRAQKVKEQK